MEIEIGLHTGQVCGISVICFPPSLPSTGSPVCRVCCDSFRLAWVQYQHVFLLCQTVCVSHSTEFVGHSRAQHRVLHCNQIPSDDTQQSRGSQVGTFHHHFVTLQRRPGLSGRKLKVFRWINFSFLKCEVGGRFVLMICNVYVYTMTTTTTTDLLIIPGLKIFLQSAVTSATVQWWWEHLIILCNVL